MINKIENKILELENKNFFEYFKEYFLIHGKEELIILLDKTVNNIIDYLNEQKEAKYNTKNIFNIKLLLEEKRALRVLIIENILLDKTLALIVLKNQRKGKINTLYLESKFRNFYENIYFKKKDF